MKKSYAVAPVVVLLGIAVFSAQCFAAQNPSSPNDQERITHNVRHEILMLPFLSVFDNIESKVDGNAVTLTGQVTRPTLKSGTERVATTVEGVSQVVNQIEVLPLFSSDDSIRRAVYYSLYSESSPLSRYGWGSIPSIHIIVNTGRVTLAGTVDSAIHKDVGTLLAKTVPGVFSVTNNLTVKHG